MSSPTNLEPWNDPALEVRVVACVLGEVSAFEAAEVTRLLEENPELAAFARRIGAVHGLLAEDARPLAGEGWKLSPERREKVLAALGDGVGAVPPKFHGLAWETKQMKRRKWRRNLLLIAASVALGVFVMTGLFSTLGFNVDSAKYVPSAALDDLIKEQENKLQQAEGRMREAMKDYGLVEVPRSIINRGDEVDDGSASSTMLAKIPVPVPSKPSSLKELSGKPGDRGGQTRGGDDGRTITLADNSVVPTGEFDGFIDTGAPIDAVVAPVIKTAEIASAGGKRQAAAEPPPPPASRPVPGEKSEDEKFEFATRNTGVVLNGGRGPEAEAAAKPAGGEESNLSLRGEVATATEDRGRMDSDAASLSSLTKGKADGKAGGTLPGGIVTRRELAEGNERKPGGSPTASEETGKLALEKAKNRPDGNGTTTLSGTSTYTGGTTITSGTRVVVGDTPDKVAKLTVQRESLLKNIDQGWEMLERPQQLTEREARDGAAAFPVTPATPTAFESDAFGNIFPTEYAPPELPNSVAPHKQNEEAARKSPVLGDIPVVGQLFQSKERSLWDDNSGVERPNQVQIETKRVEVAQANTTELGFDWLVADDGLKANVGTDHDGESLDEAKNEETKAPAPVVAPPAKPARPAAPVTIESSDARQDPVSTFSLNVSDVSFRLGARALLAEGKLPDPASVRTEDYVNAMDYGDPMPARGEAVAATIQQVAQPFVPGRNLVRVGLRTAESGRASGQALSLTIMLDQSGSMERPDRAAAVRKTMKDLAGLLHAGDVVTVIGFARTPHLLVDRLPGERAAELPKLVLQAEPEGGTNMEAAFDLAAQAATRQFKPAAGNRVVLITDGAANLGQIDPQILSARIEGMRRAHIAFDACGVGTVGIDDTMLESLARHGDGRYLVIDGDNDTSLAKELAGAFRPAARNVKVQVRFNPDRVGKFQLLGFEKHLLAERDFRDDTVDAAELAAAEQGNALYQVELLAGGSGEIGDVAVRFQDTASGKMVEKHWTIPYAANTPVLDKAAPPMQLAATAGLLAESLKGSPLGNLVRLNEMQSTGNALRHAYRGDDRAATLVQMLDKARALKSE